MPINQFAAIVAGLRHGIAGDQRDQRRENRKGTSNHADVRRQGRRNRQHRRTNANVPSAFAPLLVRLQNLLRAGRRFVDHFLILTPGHRGNNRTQSSADQNQRGQPRQMPAPQKNRHDRHNHAQKEKDDRKMNNSGVKR